jgi:hypothetical protein
MVKLEVCVFLTNFRHAYDVNCRQSVKLSYKKNLDSMSDQKYRWLALSLHNLVLWFGMVYCHNT